MHDKIRDSVKKRVECSCEADPRLVLGSCRAFVPYPPRDRCSLGRRVTEPRQIVRVLSGQSFLPEETKDTPVRGISREEAKNENLEAQKHYSSIAVYLLRSQILRACL